MNGVSIIATNNFQFLLYNDFDYIEIDKHRNTMCTLIFDVWQGANSTDLDSFSAD